MQQQPIGILGSILLLVVLAYGFAIMLGKTKELNRLLKNVGGTIFMAAIHALGRLFQLIWEEARKLHHQCLTRNRRVTILVEAGLVVGAILWLILWGGK